MLNGKTIAVVIPAFNEEKQIGMVIETMPDFVDRIIVVNDCSTDSTAEIVNNMVALSGLSSVELKNVTQMQLASNKYNKAETVLQEQNIKEKKLFNPSEVANLKQESDRLILINHKVNGGVGGAIATGYKWCKDYAIDCAAVMAGDGQMDPAELETICKPVVFEDVDYVKGNRLIHRSAWLVMPRVRYLGNSILSILTKLASGYWRVSDTQTGYTAISNAALNAIRLHQIYRSYGMPNDMLVKLNIAMCTLREVPIKPVYNVGEQSKMKLAKVVPRVSWLLLKSFVKRLWVKYFFRDFHPLFILYNLSFILFILSLPLGIKIIRIYIEGVSLNPVTLLGFGFLLVTGIQFLLFAMWMDIQDNERLYK